MPLSADDVMRALAAAAHRRDAILLAGGRDGYERPYAIALHSEGGGIEEYEVATAPDQAVVLLFDTLLRSGYIEASDFQPQVARVPLYGLGRAKTDRTLKWLGLFLSTKYLRIRYPEDLLPLSEEGEFVWEFAISAHGGPDSAERVVESIRATE